MKRPEGFDRSAEPAREPEPPQRSASPRRARAAREPRPARPPRAPHVPRAAREKVVAEHPRVEPEKARIAEAKRDRRRELRTEKSEARRFTRHSRRRRATWLTLGAIGVLLVGTLAVAIFSPVLALRTIRVDGATTVSAVDVRNAVDGQLGTPLALLDQGKLHNELAKFTLIRSYVTEIIPPGTLVIHLEERQAIGVVPDGSTFDQVDAAGVVLSTSPTRAGLPVIEIGTARPGSAAFRAAVRVLLAMPQSLARKVATITASTLDDVTLTLTGYTSTVVWGSSAQSDQKAQTLGVLLKQPHCRSHAVLDVSAPLAVGCRPASVQHTKTPSTPPPTNAPH
jgi:cell division protein FtsQ